MCFCYFWPEDYHTILRTSTIPTAFSLYPFFFGGILFTLSIPPNKYEKMIFISYFRCKNIICDYLYFDT